MKSSNISNSLTGLIRKGRSGAGLFVTAMAGLFLPGTALAQNSYTFTTCGATGASGPIQSQVNTAYSSTNLNGSVTIGTQGIQQFTVPTTGVYRIEAWGAQGFGLSGVGGRGAYMSGEFQLTAGQVLKIVVGQQGSIPASVSYNAQYSGGGGSFVTDLSNNPFVIAGGGGGNWTSNFSSTSDSPTVTAGNSGAGVGSTFGAGGTSGTGGGTASFADGGAGLTGNGAGTAGGIAFVNGANGGLTTSGIGGFGGGGGTSSFNNRRCGGGGGYSGGGAAEGATTGFPEAGGGGSINNGVNQVNTAGTNTGDGKVVITDACNLSLVASTNPICIGASLTLSTNATGSISWSSGGTTSSISISPTVTTNYTVTGTGTANCTGNSVITVTVRPLPVISTVVSPTLICVGNSANITSSGASTYTWSSGPTGTAVTANPLVNTTYSVTGTSIYGCVSSATYIVRVNTNSVTITASSNSVCSGSPVNLTATGINTYTWNTFSFFQNITVTPTANTVYSVSGRDANYCLLSRSVSIAVSPVPNITVSADRNLVCKGEGVTLTAGGASTYTWSTLSQSASISVVLPVDVTYTYMVSGTDANGCKNSANISINVSKCTGINENQNGTLEAVIYPNPGTGEFVIEVAGNQPKTIEVMDITGKLLLSQNSTDSSTGINMNLFAAGVYYVKIQSENASGVLKYIKQ